MKHLPPLIINIINGIPEYVSIDDISVLDITGCEYIGVLSLDKTIQATTFVDSKYILLHDVEAMTNARGRYGDDINILLLNVSGKVLFVVDEGRETHLEIKS